MEKYQTFLPRFLAMILDGILLSPLLIMQDSLIRTDFSNSTKIILLTLIGLVNIAYSVIMHWQFGQTVGKMLMKIKVLDITEEPLKFWQAFLRYLPNLLFMIGSLFLLDAAALKETGTDSNEMQTSPLFFLMGIWSLADIIVFFTNEKRRALHDYLANSVVVRINEQQDLSQRDNF